MDEVEYVVDRIDGLGLKVSNARILVLVADDFHAQLYHVNDDRLCALLEYYFGLDPDSRAKYSFQVARQILENLWVNK